MKQILCMVLILALTLTGCLGTTQRAEKNLIASPTNPDEPSWDEIGWDKEVSFESSPPPAQSTPQQPAEELQPLHQEVTVPEGDLVEIKEKLFIAQTNDIYLNVEDYLGKTIKYEGMFKIMHWEETGETYYYVIRYGPGCCGYDGEAGFEVAWTGEWPQEDDWCEAIGTLEIYEQNGMRYLQLVLSSLTVLEERGAEFVAQ